MLRISDLAHQVLLTMQLLGSMTVAHPGVRRELVSNGLAGEHDSGERLAITTAGRAFLKGSTVKDAVNSLQPVETLVLENLRQPRPNEILDGVILHRLKERGYVLRSGDGWRLTPYGEAELDHLQSQAAASISPPQRDDNAPDMGGGREDPT